MKAGGRSNCWVGEVMREVRETKRVRLLDRRKESAKEEEEETVKSLFEIN